MIYGVKMMEISKPSETIYNIIKRVNTPAIIG
jgi:hypothetical protein